MTGHIERLTDFEKGRQNQQAEIDGVWQPDPWVYDDQAMVVNVRKKGLIVITGCGHAGVTNILRQVRSQSGVERIYGVMGGFHLSGTLCESLIPQTVEALPNCVRPFLCLLCACSLYGMAGHSTHCSISARRVCTQ